MSRRQSFARLDQDRWALRVRQHWLECGGGLREPLPDAGEYRAAARALIATGIRPPPGIDPLQPPQAEVMAEIGDYDDEVRQREVLMARIHHIIARMQARHDRLGPDADAGLDDADLRAIYWHEAADGDDEPPPRP
jgi:hypothetical protein